MAIIHSVDLARLAAPGDIVTIVGAGGKTSTMFALSRELVADGRRVLTTKSTTIYRPTMARSPGLVDVPPERWETDLQMMLEARRELTVVVGSPTADRWEGVPPERTEELRDAAQADNVIVEADGARGRLLKAPAAHEPSMPPATNVLMPVASLSVVGSPLGAALVHRPELVAGLLGIEPGSTIRPEHLATILLSDQGGLKRAPEQVRVWPVLARVDAVNRRELSGLIDRLIENPRVAGVVTADRDWRFAALAVNRRNDTENPDSPLSAAVDFESEGTNPDRA